MSMQWSPFDKYIVARRNGSVERQCPFCGERVGDEHSKVINFVVHMGKQTADHSKSKNWGQYITRIRPPV